MSIGDREADLFEIFALARDPKSPRLLVRACRGRRHRVSTEAGRLPLWKHVQALPVASHTSVDIPRCGQHKGRSALLSVSFGTVRIDPPKGKADAPIDLWAVHLLEEDPTEGSQAVEWMLLTNVPTTSLDGALRHNRRTSASGQCRMNSCEADESNVHEAQARLRP